MFVAPLRKTVFPLLIKKVEGFLNGFFGQSPKILRQGIAQGDIEIVMFGHKGITRKEKTARAATRTVDVMFKTQLNGDYCNDNCQY